MVMFFWSGEPGPDTGELYCMLRFVVIAQGKLSWMVSLCPFNPSWGLNWELVSIVSTTHSIPSWPYAKSYFEYGSRWSGSHLIKKITSPLNSAWNFGSGESHFMWFEDPKFFNFVAFFRVFCAFLKILLLNPECRWLDWICIWGLHSPAPCVGATLGRLMCIRRGNEQVKSPV